jgi:hypothetical protein
MHSSRIRTKSEPVITITRKAFGQNKIVYFLVANKPIRYQLKRSRIIYIGTSKNGASRIGQSVIARGEPALGKWGVDKIEAHVAMCRPRQGVEIWKKLESAFVLAFRREYGVVPLYNTKLKKKLLKDEFDYFKETRLVEILSKYDK